MWPKRKKENAIYLQDLTFLSDISIRCWLKFFLLQALLTKSTTLGGTQVNNAVYLMFAIICNHCNHFVNFWAVIGKNCYWRAEIESSVGVKEGEQKTREGFSLVVQWLRIHLQCRGHRFDPCSGRIPCASWQLSQPFRACGPHETLPQREARAPLLKSSPLSVQLESPPSSDEDLAQPKINAKKKICTARGLIRGHICIIVQIRADVYGFLGGGT